MKNYLSILSGRTKLKCLGVLALTLLGSVLASVWPVRLGELYNGISSGAFASWQQGLITIGWFGAIYLAAEGIAILRRVLLDCVIADHESEVRQSSIEKLLKMPVAYNFGHNSGEKTAQLNQGVAGMSQLIKILCNDIFATVLTAVCTFIQVFLHAPGAMAAVMLVYLLLTVVASVFQIRSQNGIREKIIRKKNSLDGSICQSISNLELIRSLNAEDYERQRLTPAICGIGDTEKSHHFVMGSFDGLKQGCKVVFQVLILAISLLMIYRGAMQPGAVITVCLLFQQLVKPIDEVYRFMDETASSLVKARVLTEVFHGEADPVFRITHQDADSPEKCITFTDVLITNPPKTQALAHYDHLEIPADKVVALVGPSGSGKTTLVRGMVRFYPCIRGEVKIMGKNLCNFTQRELAETLCYMPQSSFFFSGTVRDNLVYGLTEPVSDMELYAALKKACILDALMDKAMEEGKPDCDVLALPVAENGENFSGGQRQRLTLARAFLRKPRLFIFDESTANLDGENMSLVLDNLEAHARKYGAGVLYISHDERVVKRCQQVFHLRNLLSGPRVLERPAAS